MSCLYILIFLYDGEDKGKIQGNAPVTADGTAVVSLHLPSGISFKAVETWEAFVFILDNNKNDTLLYKTSQPVTYARFAANINLSFTADFELVPP